MFLTSKALSLKLNRITVKYMQQTTLHEKTVMGMILNT